MHHSIQHILNYNLHVFVIKHIHIFKKIIPSKKYKLNICEIQIKHANAMFLNMKLKKKLKLDGNK